MAKDAPDWQEAHSPTEPYEITISHATRRSKAIATRRKQDCRLWEGMTSEMESAAEAIRIAIALQVGEVGMARSSFERLDRGYDLMTNIAWQRRVIEAYHSWCEDCKNKGIISGLVLLVIYEGASLREAARCWRRSRDWVKEQVHRGLELYLDDTNRVKLAESLRG